MPIYRVQAPDGSILRIEGPEGATEAQLIEAAQAGYQPKAKAETFDPTEGMSTAEKLMAGMGKKFVDTGRGLGQLVGLVSQADVDESKRLDAPLMETGAGAVGYGGGALVETLGVPWGIAKGLGMIPNLGRVGALMAQVAENIAMPKTVAQAAAGAGLYGASQPGTVGERLQTGGIGAALGAGGQALGNLVGRAVRPIQKAPTPERAALIAAAQREGIPLDVAQQTGSRPLKIVSGALENLPGSSGIQRQAIEGQQRAFTRAVMRKVGEDADSAAPHVLAAARRRIGADFEGVFENVTIPLDKAVPKIQAISEQANKRLPADQARIVNGYIDDLITLSRGGRQAPGLLDDAAKPVAKAAATAAKKPSPLALNFERDSLGDAVRKMGGINIKEGGGELRWLRESALGKPHPVYGPLARRQGGKSWDAMAELAHEAGYIDEATPNALMDALANEASGSRVFSLNMSDDTLARMRLGERYGDAVDIPTSEGVPLGLAGKAYQAWRSEIASQAKTDSSGFLRDILGKLYRAVDDEAYKAVENPSTLREARRQWGNLKTVEKAMKGASEGAAVGELSPARLWSAASQAQPKNFVAGAGELNDLARIGQAFLKQYPSSGTAERLAMQGLLTGTVVTPQLLEGDWGGAAAYGLGSILAPRLIARGMQQPWMQQYLLRGVPVGPETAAIGESLRRLMVGGGAALPVVAGAQQ